MRSLHQPLFVLLMGSLVLAGLAPLPGCAPNQDPSRTTADETTALPEDSEVETDVPYVRTPQVVVDRMLELAEVTEDDVVYDLGSGDGRFVITAAERYGARGVGIDIDPERIKEARDNAEEAGVTDRVEFRRGDLFEADFSDATVVTLYLLPDVNLKLRPELFMQLDPGNRVVSHDFDMGNWEPDLTEEVDNNTIYLWTIPSQIPDSLESPEQR